MKIFVTGITGFVGGAVANHFAALGHTVCGIGRKAALPYYISNSCSYSTADICSPVKDIDADIIIHAAAVVSDTVTYKHACKVNVEGTTNVLRAAKNSKHFIYISSSSVYDFKNERMNESEAGTEFNHLSVYGKSKWLAEGVINKIDGNFKKTILRPRAIYGKHDHVLLPRLLKMVKGNKIFLPDHLSKQISLTHINNLILAIELCINKQEKASEIFNVADKEVYDLNKVLTTLLSAVTSKQLHTFIIPKLVFERLIAINEKLKLCPDFNRFAASSLTGTGVLDIEKISKTLGYFPIKNFRNSYIEIADWMHNEEGSKFFKEIPSRKLHL